MSPIEIGPDGAPIVTPSTTPPNPQPGDQSVADSHTSETPFVVPQSESVAEGEVSHLQPVNPQELTDDEARGKEEQTPHTDRKENDAMSESTAPPLPQNLPPTLVPGAGLRETASVPVEEVLDVMPDPEKEERETLRAQKADILKEHLGQESNIPLNHSYWGLSNRLRVLDKQLLDRAIVWGNRMAQATRAEAKAPEPQK